MSEQAPKAQPTDRARLQSLTVQFDVCSLSLMNALDYIGAWAKGGYPLPMPDPVRMSMARAPDDMNECRYLLGEIEPITQRMERGPALGIVEE